MGTFTDELEAMMDGRAPGPKPEPPAGLPTVQKPPGTPTLTEELEGMMQPQGPTPSPTPSGPTEFNLVGLGRWVANNPGPAAELLGQMFGSAGGIMLGTPGGPVGQAAGGAAGSVAGRQVVRGVERLFGASPEEAPLGDPLEMALDAAGGAAGPALAAAPKGLARLTTGINRQVRREASEAGEQARIVEAAKPRPIDPRTGEPIDISVADLNEAGQAGHDEALRRALSRRSLGAGTAMVGSIGAVAHAVVSGDVPTAAGLMVGGAAGAYAQRQIAARLLRNDRIREWIIKEGTSPARTGTSIAATLSALAGETWLTEDQRSAVSSLLGSAKRRQMATEAPRDGSRFAPWDAAFRQRARMILKGGQ